MKFDCGVEVVTRYRALTLLAANGRGEISGAVSLASSAPQKLPGFHLGLYDSNGRLALSAVSANDGRYDFTNVPAGHYLLMADAKDAYDRHLLRPAPEFIDIGYGSGVVTGRNIALVSPTARRPTTWRWRCGRLSTIMQRSTRRWIKTRWKDKVVVLNLSEATIRAN